MQMPSVYKYFLDTILEKGAVFAVVVDQDRIELQEAANIASQIEKGGADAIFVGTSLMLKHTLEEAVKRMKSAVAIPIVLFPGDVFQVCHRADAVLFLSLISGRNAELLIGEHVKVALLVRSYGLEVIPVGYMLVESTCISSVQFMSNTIPIPRAKPDIAVAHAVAGQLLGMKMIYLEGGSGSSKSVPNTMIRAVKENLDIPLVVSGGIRSPEEAAEKVNSGADVVVIGSSLELEANRNRVQKFATAIHRRA